MKNSFFLPCLVIFCLSTRLDALVLIDELFGLGVSAIGLLVNNRQFTLNTLNYYFSLMENNPAFVPDEVQQLMFGLSTQSKRQIVTLVNDVAAGRLILPKDPHQIGSVIAGRVPEVANRFPQALATIRKNQACMSQDTRDEIKQWYLRAAAILAGPRQRLVSGTAAWIADIKDAFDDADDSIKEDVQQCEPAAYRLLESGIITNFAHGARIFSDSVRPIANIGNPENDNKGNPEPENKGNPENPEITDATTCAQESTT